MQLHFLVPDPSSFQSGGNRYNAGLIAALKRKEVHVSHSPFDSNVYYGSPGTTYIIDSIYFEDIGDPAQAMPPRCIGLIHHLNSMYPATPGHFETHEAPVLAHCTGFIATSTYTREYLVEHACDPERIVIIEPALAPQQAEIKRSVSRVRALIVANCEPRKGILEFLMALAAAQPQPFFELNIIGSLEHDPDYAAQCQQAILKDDILTRCVHLLGTQDEDTLIRLYQTSNLFLSTSFFETFGMAIQEALIHGLPALVHTGGNSPNHVREGVNGHVFDTHTAMAKSFAHYVDDITELARLHDSMGTAPVHYLSSYDEAADLLIRYLGWAQQ